MFSVEDFVRDGSHVYCKDASIAQVNLDSAHFPGISSSVKVHDGFGDAQLK